MQSFSSEIFPELDVVRWAWGQSSSFPAAVNNLHVKFDIRAFQRMFHAMKANPGGQIDSKAVIGRGPLIQQLWEILEVQSLIITAERRIGKTTVMKKIQREPIEGWLPVYQDLESCHSALEFAMSVYREIHQFLGGRGKLARRSKEFFAALGGTEIGGVFKLPEKAAASWKDVLTKAIEDLMEENDGRTKLLFLWDEMPFMLMNIRNGEGEQTAMQVLDHLRWLRQTHDGLRMVITGSIGLHHVISSLKDKNYANAPVNDMAAVDVPPLTDEDAVDLAKRLIEGESLRSPDVVLAARSVAVEADCFPFYVHHIARGLKLGGLEATPENVAKVVSSHLLDANDPWELLHYRERISTYYPDDERTVCLILDQLTVKQATVAVDDLLVMLKGASTFDDREHLLRLLSLLERDHYLQRAGNGQYQFRFPLIRRWWKINRGL
jgi:hypothetical protein